MKQVYFILMTLSLVACNNGKKMSAISEGQAERDSVAMALKADSVEREQIFETRGDTVFGTMRFGMDKTQAKQSANEFMKSLNGNGNGFTFGSYSFRAIEYFKNFEELSEYDLRHFELSNLLYKNKLFSVCWESFYEDAKDGEEIANRLSKFISYFEAKYGKCSKKDLSICNRFGDYIMKQRVYVHGIVAIWETSKRRIQIELDEKMDADMPTRRSGSFFHYGIRVVFVDTTVEKIVNALREEIIKRDRVKQIEQHKRDSAKLVKSL